MILRRTQPSPPRRVLVVTLADLGDALLTTPALQALRQAQPQAHVTVLTTPGGAQALRGLPAIDKLILFPKQLFNQPRSLLRPANLRTALGLWRQLRSGGYDTCILFHQLTTWFGTAKYAALAWASGAQRRLGRENGRGFFLTDRIRDDGFGARHQATYWLELVGLLGPVAPALPRYTVSEADTTAAAALIEPYGSALHMVALHPGSGAFAPARRWESARYAALADALVADGNGLVLVGGPEEADLRMAVLGAMRRPDAVLDLGGRTSLGVLAAVLQRCTLFVGNDSGVAHLAASVGTPVVGIFGPTDPRAYGPYGGADWTVADESPNGVAELVSGPHRALKAEIACSPCIYRGHALGTPEGCPDRTCLARIQPDLPLTLVRRRLRELSEQPCASTT